MSSFQHPPPHLLIHKREKKKEESKKDMDLDPRTFFNTPHHTVFTHIRNIPPTHPNASMLGFTRFNRHTFPHMTVV
ncbi:hypothetical protein PTT_15386 [Pyrenophora teres f. teres 0-1]|uniref:Uncharacterized protein n=1 Tax=Pyrenophora teres f. teres (strain 0-1) TaxID=861557 RepID=E3S039_PYRTT|nr:hypothetical protein PTT_15386 [Pyrenophora teres f. teres 0-1]